MSDRLKTSSVDCSFRMRIIHFLLWKPLPALRISKSSLIRLHRMDSCRSMPRFAWSAHLPRFRYEVCWSV